MAEAPAHLKLEGVTVVTFEVGPDKAVFQVHQNLLCDASTVFKAAFSGNFREASERSMSLPDHDKDSVGRMIQWLYTRKFELTFPVSSETSGECYMQLAKLNTLADKYDIYLLKNQIVDELFDLTKPPRGFKAPQISVVAYVFNNTTEGSSFRKLLVAWYAYRIDLEWYDFDNTKAALAEVSQEFTIDLVVALGVRQKYPERRSPFTLPSSVYHEAPLKKTDEGHA
ncbi:hypothetical protein HO133_004194 [Letharia lupina]|uniref:BTB domain-containing protein n=1 Tax=Letharia lupina TaxID=560253 RepID=A0A8H6FJX1_9LECA|nr:uncharacterized protein HO133_004194 [Letharia lupina]KAF6229857.1 hypothetical protein HO133_004194 [Letharia lupina]